MQRANLNGVDIEYAAGLGDPLVLIHGGWPAASGSEKGVGWLPHRD